LLLDSPLTKLEEVLIGEMSSKCAMCQKTVYFAEKQSYDGKDYHGVCLQTLKKNQKTSLSGHTIGFSSYPQAPASSSGNSAAKFCPSCGTKNETANSFCSNCGNKL